jgi:protein SCO1/2
MSLINHRYTTIASFLVILFGFVLFYIGTDGFSAFTAETARVNQLIKETPKFPDVTFEDSNGKTYSMSEFEDKHLFITFFYTSCWTECPVLEMNMARVYNLLPDKVLGEDIIFLSISIDPKRDDPSALDKYKDHFNIDGEAWRMVRIKDQYELDTLLDTFGVIVIPDGASDFAHNSAFYLVDNKGFLIDVMDFTEVEAVANKIEGILKAKREG